MFETIQISDDDCHGCGIWVMGDFVCLPAVQSWTFRQVKLLPLIYYYYYLLPSNYYYCYLFKLWPSYLSDSK